MKFVEELVISGKSRLKRIADFIVGELGVSAVAFKDATSVGVDYEDGMFAGVEKDGVCGFRADPAQGEKLIAEDGGGSCEKAGE